MNRSTRKDLILVLLTYYTVGLVLIVLPIAIIYATAKPNGFAACSPGWKGICIKADERSDFQLEDNCLVNIKNRSSGRICGSYKITTTHGWRF